MKIHFLSISLFISTGLAAQGKFYGGSGDGFATATITNNVLPVQVLHFSATPAWNGVNALLQLSSPQQVCAVQLEKSTDGRVFVPATAVQTVTAVSNGVFHFNSPAALAGTAFFRVAITRCNGSVLYTAAVHVNTKTQTAIYVSGGLLYWRQAPPSSIIRLLNAAGQQVFEKRLNGGSGVQALGLLPRGIYFIKLDDGAAVKVILE